LKNAGELFITLLGCARRAISSPGNSSLSAYVEPRSAVLEKLRGAINHSHFIIKHIVGGMDATKAFMCFRCTFKAFGVLLWHFKVVQMNQGVILKHFF
jgi:hypothetical protein